MKEKIRPSYIWGRINTTFRSLTNSPLSQEGPKFTSNTNYRSWHLKEEVGFGIRQGTRHLITSLDKVNNQNDGSKELKSFNILNFPRPTGDGRPRLTIGGRLDSQNSFGPEPYQRPAVALGPLSLAFIALSSSKFVSLASST
ncbi:hypothetical protein M9H77_07209 [Catharanthus roseus]|uniref:Uncharacterized protein n=1 Tax=Catharanthus roseus TaxID=4058 RepID=A0ACC0BUI4_CATRO|nr:hypothetical protein M9H77_07209 [Catharanthus roseus]